VAGEGRRLRRDPLHEISVTRNGIGIVVHDFIPRAIEPGSEEALCYGHTHAISEPLPQGPGGAFHTWGFTVFRMPWGFAFPLTEPSEFLDGQRISGEMEKGIEESGTMTGREHKAVSIRPRRILGIML
jgi:hypothetical protein